MKQSLFVLGLTTTATAFTGPVLPNTRPETVLFGGGRGGSTTLDGKKKTIASVKELLDSSGMMRGSRRHRRPRLA